MNRGFQILIKYTRHIYTSLRANSDCVALNGIAIATNCAPILRIFQVIVQLKSELLKFTRFTSWATRLMSRTLGNIFYCLFEKPFLREYQYSRSMNINVMTNVYTHAHRGWGIWVWVCGWGGGGLTMSYKDKNNYQISQFYCLIL